MDVGCTNCSAMTRLSTWTAFNDLTMTWKRATRVVTGEREDVDAIDTDVFALVVEVNHRRMAQPCTG